MTFRNGQAALAAVVLLSSLTVCAAIEAIMGQFSLAEYPMAVCNDGSPGNYYFRRAQLTQQRSIWVVRFARNLWSATFHQLTVGILLASQLYLGGGGWCFSAVRPGAPCCAQPTPGGCKLCWVVEGSVVA